MGCFINRTKASAVLNKAIVFFTLCVFLFSCKDDKDYLSLSTDYLDVKIEGEKVSFTISSNISWNISTADSWVSANLSEGSGKSEIVLNIDPNRSGGERKTTISVTGVGASLAEKIEIEQDAAYLSLNTSEIVFDLKGTPQEITVTSNYQWNILKSNQADWCAIDILTGDGNSVVTFSPTPYTERVLRSDCAIVFTCFGSETKLTIGQEIENEAPTTPVLLSPANSSAAIDIPVSFSWEPSVDSDNDIVYYDFYLSENAQDWENIFSEITDTEVSVTATDLNNYSNYYWKVIAKDKLGGQSESETYNLTTGENLLYLDGQVLVYQEFSAPSVTRPVNLVVVGDGFIEEDYRLDGAFDKATETAIEAFFGIEPYTTYRDYFTTYKVAAYSEERGATVKETFSDRSQSKQDRNTVFSCVLDGGSSTGINCDFETVFKYVMKIPAITASELLNTTVLVIINLDVYAGTAIMWGDGKAIAMCPTGETLGQIVQHEGGGHAFAKLYDEYIYYPSQSYPDKDIENLVAFRQGDPWSFGANLSITGEVGEIHWKHYFVEDGYEAVGIYEGGAKYGKNVWRPENNSCMNDNSPYFNASSREAIVRRIMSINNKNFDYSDFYSKDLIRSMPSSRSVNVVNKPLAPPILKR